MSFSALAFVAPVSNRRPLPPCPFAVPWGVYSQPRAIDHDRANATASLTNFGLGSARLKDTVASRARRLRSAALGAPTGASRNHAAGTFARARLQLQREKVPESTLHGCGSGCQVPLETPPGWLGKFVLR